MSTFLGESPKPRMLLRGWFDQLPFKWIRLPKKKKKNTPTTGKFELVVKIEQNRIETRGWQSWRLISALPKVPNQNQNQLQNQPEKLRFEWPYYNPRRSSGHPQGYCKSAPFFSSQCHAKMLWSFNTQMISSWRCWKAFFPSPYNIGIFMSRRPMSE